MPHKVLDVRLPAMVAHLIGFVLQNLPAYRYEPRTEVLGPAADRRGGLDLGRGISRYLMERCWQSTPCPAAPAVHGR
jgi:hypothetical protein